ncbi:cystathionine beta-synthase [Thermosporothrix hazakensis]|uniref:Cystathionine beta-synthase n=3 Tax=Thermosporothrix TaxID=768650 RepID=A0A326U5L1_THEHA|nr:cystathionine beta-synthase [Thermosporothrix hazakensis]BBH88210.1 putative cystathionine beta-synthase [Thermosporothrix sp. COM3]GCE46398.1 putative cystathionine beta-synthase [Thermosporothrix hazakensis]
MNEMKETVPGEMRYRNSILETIGNTPLIRLRRVAADVPPLVLAKVEFFNPGGSVKDRIGPAMIEYCEQKGLLRPGGTIVEPTSGNTGHGLAIAAALKGYHCIFVMTDKVSEEKRSLLRAYGAEIVICPSNVTHDSPEYYKNVAYRLAKEIPGAVCPDQYSNPANPEAHYRTTGPEIWRDTAGKLTAFVAGIGTGGTITGVARYLKEQNPNVKIIGADPPGSVYSGDEPGPYKVEGIGMDMFPRNYHPELVDEVIRIDDRTSFYWARRLAREEGILVGGSAGTALAAALTYARRLTKDDVLVVLLPDTGRGYLSKQFNDTWMRENNLLVQAESEQPTMYDVLTYRRQHMGNMPLVVSVAPNDSIANAVELLRRYGISQTPVMEHGTMVGSLTEDRLLKRLASGEPLEETTVGQVQGPPFPTLEANAPAREAYTLFTMGHVAVAVMANGLLEGIVTKSDLLEFWAHSR